MKKRLLVIMIAIGLAILAVQFLITDLTVAKDDTAKAAVKEISKEIIGKDGAKMVLIPAGKFQMGSNDGGDDEKPVHTVYLDAFYIDKYEVTNAQYRKFVKATGHKEPFGISLDSPAIVSTGGISVIEDFQPWSDKNYNGDNQPVVCVNWEDAKAYADWAGKRLPTEAEWEKAARGGLVGKRYVWGDDWPPPKSAGNFADETFKKARPDQSIIMGYDDGYAYPAPVGSFNKNGYGLYDMEGNVEELCLDWYDASYYINSPKQNPTGPSSESTHITRGGSWYDSEVKYLRVAKRDRIHPKRAICYYGFRCVAQN